MSEGMDREKIRALIAKAKGVEKDVEKNRQILLAEAGKVWPFKSRSGKRITFIKMDYPAAERIIFAHMPESLKQAGQDEEVALTSEDRAVIFEIACQAIAHCNLEALDAGQVAALGKDFVDEANAFLMEISGLSPHAVNSLDFFRDVGGRVRLRLHLLRAPAQVPMRASGAVDGSSSS